MALFLLILIFTLLYAPHLVHADSLADYESGLDRSCSVDADCAVMNVGNCCGYYPGCLNKAATPDPERVSRLCAENDMAGICGFPSIENCSCIGGQCQPAQGSGTPSAPVAQ
jgi:hypothetical protein